MPRVFLNNKYWLRGGRLNQKRHLDMTEEEKSQIARCLTHPPKKTPNRSRYGWAFQIRVSISSDRVSANAETWL